MTNLAGVDYSITLGVPKLLFSYDGTTWVSGSTRLVTNTEVRIAFQASDYSVGMNPIPVPMPASVTNVVVYAMNTPSLFGTTNALYGAKLFLGEPQTPTEAATKGYVDDVFSGTAWWSAGTAVQINGYDLNMSSLWSLSTSTADTNLGTFHLKYLGEYILTASQSNAVNVTGLSLAVDGTNIVATLATNGLSSEPRLQFTHLLTPLNWYWLTNTPAIVTTNYVWTFPFPYADSGFLVSMVAPTNLATVAVSGHLTATGVFSGNGSGLTNLPAGAVVSGTFDAARIPVVAEAAHSTNADLATRATASTSSTNFYGVLASTNLPPAYVAPQSAHATNADVAAFVSGTLTNSITGNAATATTAASGGTSQVMCGGVASMKFSTTSFYAPTWGSGTVTYNTTEASGSCPTVYLSSRIGTNLNIKISPAPSAATNVVFTVMTNGVATALTATIVAGATTGNSGTTSCVFPASGTTSLKILGNNSTAGAATIYWWNMEVR